LPRPRSAPPRRPVGVASAPMVDPPSRLDAPDG
jgi:hypothetical protein